MFWRIIGRLACVVFVSFSQTTVTASQAPCEDELELTLAAIGPGPAEEMKSRLINVSSPLRRGRLLTRAAWYQSCVS